MEDFTVQVRLRSPEGYMPKPDGRMFVEPRWLEWSEVPFLLEGCEHKETVCPHCLDSWLNDHEVDMTAALGEVLLERHPELFELDELLKPKDEEGE